MNENLELRLEKYREFKKRIDEIPDGYLISAHLKEYSFTFNQFGDHFVVSRCENDMLARNLGVKDNIGSARKFCYEKLLAFAMKNLHIDGEFVLEDYVWAHRNNGGVTFCLGIRSFSDEYNREKMEKRARRHRELELNPELRPRYNPKSVQTKETLKTEHAAKDPDLEKNLNPENVNPNKRHPWYKRMLGRLYQRS